MCQTYSQQHTTRVYISRQCPLTSVTEAVPVLSDSQVLAAPDSWLQPFSTDSQWINGSNEESWLIAILRSWFNIHISATLI